MGEFINNASQRKEALKELIRNLHRGGNREEIELRFAELVDDLTPVEIAGIEQELINEGLPVEEVQSLCDVHVAMFRKALDGGATEETPPGHPVHTFKMENLAISELLLLLTNAVGDLSSEGAWQRVARFSEQLRELEKLYQRKENLLFPIIERHGMTGPSSVMWAGHNDIRALLREVSSAVQAEEQQALPGLLAQLSEAVSSMIYKDEHVLYPSALKLLDDSEWASIQEHSEEIGYCLIRPGDEWQPRPSSGPQVAEPTAVRTSAGAMALDTGKLTQEQINLLLTSLPVDVTFVDENDTVRYYSQGKERIFTRTPAIIGRKVQNCHPPASVHVVSHIIDEMRAGTRDMAAFWIQLGDQFVHIRYFALRDGNGEYRGVIEVTQDIAPLRALEGERRLLDETSL